ncbi:Ca-activated chloride channel family protein [Sulfurivirga caldicuralii]|uniref:Ca-activated chloride channel family protein n=1 Tax=Sulfurivirga caldicuralii TaxID=364032 RepID=A0A1N6HCT9_9GAMM|nr:VWA domain-containing protein [Sulfurivirga caldicuralii]SIO17590.1 Ca-activated chloride channel family protein [Sulfurivirga caldicuralii]
MTVWLDAIKQLDFLWPWAIALLPLPWFVRQWLPPAPQEAPIEAPTLMEGLKAAVGGEKGLLQQRIRRERIPIWAWWLWALVVLAAMRPVWYATPTDFTQRGKDILLAVDLSGSMEKPDMRVRGQPADRLTVVKQVVRDFIAKRKHDRVGLIVFGSRAFFISPLTYDLNTVQTLLDESEIGMAGNNTAIGDAIAIALKHAVEQDAHKPVLILLTDGANTDGITDPLAAARQAKKQGLKIYTIAIGRDNTLGKLLGGGYDYDEEILKKIATQTGGRFFRASDAQSLAQVYDTINKLESAPYAIHSLRAHSELFVWPLGIVLLISFLIAGSRLRRQRT